MEFPDNPMDDLRDFEVETADEEAQDRKPGPERKPDIVLSRAYWAVLNLLLYAALAWMLWDTYQLQKLISK